jgi:hypothetical protein
MMLMSPIPAPPMTVPWLPPVMKMPLAPLGMAGVAIGLPSWVSPMMLPLILLELLPLISMPFPLFPEITFPSLAFAPPMLLSLPPPM